MKLTKIHREAFVKAVMQDVPKVDYIEEARKLVLNDSIEQLPAQLRPAALDKELSPYLRTDTHYQSAFSQSFSVFSHRGSYYTPSKKCKPKLDELGEKHKSQKQQREALKERVEGVIASCTTLKIAKERLPEFIKYLPEEVEKSQNLPAIANLAADLVKMGWPKDKQPATA